MRPEHYLQAAQAHLVASAGVHARHRDRDEGPLPFLTISREAGAGAHELGERLIEVLNRDRPAIPWALFDDNLVQEVLRKHDLPKNLARYLSEDGVAEVREFIEVSLGLHPHKDALVGKVNSTIISLARIGHVVMVGRGAHVLTRALKGGLHLRLVADPQKRAAYYSRVFDLDRSTAATRIEALDAGRRAYLKRHFGEDVADPHAYDIVINTTSQLTDDLVRMLVTRLSRIEAQAGIR